MNMTDTIFAVWLTVIIMTIVGVVRNVGEMLQDATPEERRKIQYIVGMAIIGAICGIAFVFSMVVGTAP